MTVLHAVLLRPSEPGTYQAVLAGKPLGRPCRAPLAQAARLLMGRGRAASEVVEARHQGSPVVAVRATLGELGAYTYEDGGKVVGRSPYKPPPRLRHRPPIAA